MKTLENVYNAVSTASNAKGDSIHNLPGSVGRVLAALQADGISIGGLS